MENEYFIIITILFISIIFSVILLNFFKISIRKINCLIIKKTLNSENRKKIIDEKDIEFLEEMLVKFKWYYKNWWVNLTPIYYKRIKKVKKIAKKYNLDIDLLSD